MNMNRILKQHTVRSTRVLQIDTSTIVQLFCYNETQRSPFSSSLKNSAFAYLFDHILDKFVHRENRVGVNEKKFARGILKLVRVYLAVE